MRSILRLCMGEAANLQADGWSNATAIASEPESVIGFRESVEELLT